MKYGVIKDIESLLSEISQYEYYSGESKWLASPKELPCKVGEWASKAMNLKRRMADEDV